MNRRSRITRRAFLERGAAAAGTLAIAACGPASPVATSASPQQTAAASPSPSPKLTAFNLQEIEAAAQKEGTITVYLSSPEIVDEVGKAFKAKYPWATWKTYGSSLGDVTNKYTAEFRSGVQSADLVQATPWLRTTYLKDKMMAVVRTPAEASLPAGLLDPDGYMHPVFQSFSSLQYNTNLVKTPPSAVEALGDAVWKGKLAMEGPRTQSLSFAFLSSRRKIMGDAKWRTWLSQLKANGVRLTQSTSASYNLVLQGEQSICIGGYSDVFKQKAGAPVAAWFPKEIDTLYLTWFIPPNAPHANMSRLFLHFIQTEPGQRRIAATGRAPIIAIPDLPIASMSFIPPGSRVLGLVDYQEAIDDPDFFNKVYEELGW